MFDLSILFAALARHDVPESGASRKADVRDWHEAFERASAGALGMAVTPVAVAGEPTTRIDTGEPVPPTLDPWLPAEAGPVAPETAPEPPARGAGGAPAPETPSRAALAAFRAAAQRTAETEPAPATVSDATLALGNAAGSSSPSRPATPGVRPVPGEALPSPDGAPRNPLAATAAAAPNGVEGTRAAETLVGEASVERPPSLVAFEPRPIEGGARPAAPSAADAPGHRVAADRFAAPASSSGETPAHAGDSDGRTGDLAPRGAQPRADGADPASRTVVERPVDRARIDIALPRTAADRSVATVPMMDSVVSPSGSYAGRADGAPILARIPHQDLAEALVARARALPANGSLELRFALEPEDLGPVRVQIVSRGEQIEIRILATSGAAVEALGTGLGRLTSQLVEAGFKDPAIQLALGDSADPGGRRSAHDTGDHPHRPRSFVRERPVLESLVRPDGSALRAGRLDRTA